MAHVKDLDPPFDRPLSHPTLGRRIWACRLAAGIKTRKLFAERMGVAFTTADNWERFNSVPELETLERIADLVGVSLEDLRRGKNVDASLAVPEPPPKAARQRNPGEPRREQLQASREPDDVVKEQEWTALHLRTRGFVEDTERWDRAVARIRAAAGRQGPTAKLVEDIVSLILREEKDREQATPAPRALSTETSREELHARGIRTRTPKRR
jgi:transcriptional regulator with XRE-family HTH domain